MIKSYCNYGIYNEKTSQCLEEGDDVDQLTYWDDGRRVVLENVHISEITSDDITCELEDFKEITISIETIEDWA